MSVLLFVIAAGLGTSIRFAAAQIAIARFDDTWPGTLAVNVVGSFALGWIVASHGSDATAIVLGAGFCGSLTTFSMFALESLDGPRRRRAFIVVSNLAAGLLAAAFGHTLA